MPADERGAGSETFSDLEVASDFLEQAGFGPAARWMRRRIARERASFNVESRLLPIGQILNGLDDARELVILSSSEEAFQAIDCAWFFLACCWNQSDQEGDTLLTIPGPDRSRNGRAGRSSFRWVDIDDRFRGPAHISLVCPGCGPLLPGAPSEASRISHLVGTIAGPPIVRLKVIRLTDRDQTAPALYAGRCDNCGCWLAG